MVPPSSDRISRVPPYFSYAQYHNCVFEYGAITHYGRPFQTVLLTRLLSRTGSSAFARHYLRNLGWFLFLSLLRCFSSGGYLHLPIYSVNDIQPSLYRLLHSEICGSKCTYHSPQLIAVNHVLLRLPMPRHSPCALFSFTICSCFWVLLNC